MSKDNVPGQIDGSNKGSPEVDQELSQVATNPKQSILILVGVIAVFAYLFFNLFIKNSLRVSCLKLVEVFAMQHNIIRFCFLSSKFSQIC